VTAQLLGIREMLRAAQLRLGVWMPHGLWLARVRTPRVHILHASGQAKLWLDADGGSEFCPRSGDAMA
jgi:hypothetical protein